MVEMAGGGWEKLKKGKKGRTVEMNKNTSSKEKKDPFMVLHAGDTSMKGTDLVHASVGPTIKGHQIKCLQNG